MKQFNLCIGFTILTYIISSVGGNTFNPFEWSDGPKIIFGLGLFITWGAPVFVNYLDGDENFK